MDCFALELDLEDVGRKGARFLGHAVTAVGMYSSSAIECSDRPYVSRI
jgi:hypothetical protein